MLREAHGVVNTHKEAFMTTIMGVGPQRSTSMPELVYYGEHTHACVSTQGVQDQAAIMGVEPQRGTSTPEPVC